MRVGAACTGLDLTSLPVSPLPAASVAAPACLQLVQPRPCHYLNLPKEELATFPNMGKYGLS